MLIYGFFYLSQPSVQLGSFSTKPPASSDEEQEPLEPPSSEEEGSSLEHYRLNLDDIEMEFGKTIEGREDPTQYYMRMAMEEEGFWDSEDLEPSIRSFFQQLMDSGSMPVDKGYLRVTSGYGMRRHPITGENEFHHGIDIARSQNGVSLIEGENIYAMLSGRVEYAGSADGYGNLVVLDHGDRVETFYAHMQQINVSEGDRVSTGDVIGTVGSTGMSTGPHLHLEIRKNNETIDPEPIVMAMAGETMDSSASDKIPEPSFSTHDPE